MPNAKQNILKTPKPSAQNPKDADNAENTEDDEDTDPIQSLITALQNGVDWPTALLRAMAAWRAPHDAVGDLRRDYFIGGEAFDWLLLAERLCEAAGDLIHSAERDDLLFNGNFPPDFDRSRFKELLGAQKHSAYLNYFYGVIVEEALQLAVENEVHKRHISNGNQYQNDFTEEALFRIYRGSTQSLLSEFCAHAGYPPTGALTLTQSKEFTYWLFKRRLHISDKARVASDTRKGIDQLQRIADARPGSSPIFME